MQDGVRMALADAIKQIFDLDPGDFAVEVPPRTELGDLAFPVAFDLAKRLKARTGRKHNPREIANQLAGKLRNIEGVARVELAGAGYINVFLDRSEYLIGAIEQPESMHPALGGKIIVEHTAVNPNKAAHIGHLRNAFLGDTTVRILRTAGEQVEAQNYIDNTGVQVADVVVGFKHLEGRTLDYIKSIATSAEAAASTPEAELRGGITLKPDYFDYYCWDLYSRVGRFYEEDASRLELRTKTLHEIEAGQGETYEIADYVSTRVLRCHLETMLRVGVEYDLLPRESDVLHLHIWERAFALLKERGAVVFETEGKLAGCWVMRSTDSRKGHKEHEVHKDKKPGSEALHTLEGGSDKPGDYEADKVIVRSNGTVTYTGKDIALHLWKLGQLDVDFYYRPFFEYPGRRDAREPATHTAWITTSDANQNDPSHVEFGKGAAYMNVIDIGQSYPQHYVKLGVMAVDHDERVERSAHLAYEKVVLTPAAADLLGQTLTDEDRARSGITMSGRKGLGVKVDYLVDQLEISALAEVAARHPDLSDEDQRDAAHRIAIGALRYFLLKYSRTSIISFDFKEALSFEGETGPYVQYSIVRANSIFRKLAAAGLTTADDQAATIYGRWSTLLHAFRRSLGERSRHSSPPLSQSGFSSSPSDSTSSITITTFCRNRMKRDAPS
jgi:arginyl-tRNA synthetase